MLFWSVLITWLQENCFEIMISALVSFMMYDKHLDGIGSWMSQFHAYFLSALCCLLPLIILVYALSDWEPLYKKEVTSKLDSLVNSVDSRNSFGKLVLVQPLLFYIRRLAFGLAMIYIEDALVQVVFLIFSTLFAMVFTGSIRPLRSKFFNNIELFNLWC